MRHWNSNLDVNSGRMGEIRDNDGYEEELVDYDEEEQNAPNSVSGKPNGESAKKLVSFN